MEEQIDFDVYIPIQFRSSLWTWGKSKTKNCAFYCIYSTHLSMAGRVWDPGFPVTPSHNRFRILAVQDVFQASRLDATFVFFLQPACLVNFDLFLLYCQLCRPTHIPADPLYAIALLSLIVAPPLVLDTSLHAISILWPNLYVHIVRS
jgi:hypothetical protein